MTNNEAVNWIINISADIGKAEHHDLWHYEQALSEIREMLETAQPSLQPTCNQLATDCISRRAAIGSVIAYNLEDEGDMASLVMILQNLPSAQQEIIFCKGCKHRNTDECPMYYEEWIEYDEGDGFVERDFIPQDRTVSDGFCFKGERREDE